MLKAGLNHVRFCIVIVILLAMALYSVLYRPGVVKGDINTEILKKDVGGWKFVNDIKLDYKIYTALDPDTLVFSNYVNDKGQMINLVVVYHRNNRWGAHDPTVCYKSQGWQLIEKPHDINIPYKNSVLEVKKFIVKKDQVSSIIYYNWFSSNKRVFSSRNKQMFDMVLNGLFKGYTESGFLRFSITIDPLNEKKTVTDLNDFTSRYIEVFLKKGPQ